MNKKKTAVLTLLLVVIVVLTSCLLYACNPNGSVSEDKEPLEPTEGLLIQNGDFKLIDEDATSYPRSLDNWSGSKMYSSSSFRDDVIAGAISLDSTLYGANKSAWDDADDALRQALVTGGHGDEDDENKNVLMIYQPKVSKDENDNDKHGPTAYGYTSASFTLSKGSYYLLSVDVLTYDIYGSVDDKGDQKASAEPGARIYVSSNTYAEFASINTEGQWKTYRVYIETSPSSSTSLTVQLGLGKYTASYSDGLTSGYAFFDNLSLKKLVTKADHEDIENDDVANLKVDDPQKEYETALKAEQDSDGSLEVGQGKTVQVTTTTLKVPNGRFDFGSYNLSSTGVPNSWTHVTGNSGKDDAAPTGLGYNAIIDTTKFADNFSKYSSSYRTKTGAEDPERLYTPAQTIFDDQTLRNRITNYEDRVGNNIFMLSQQLMTAQGIRSSRTITIEKGKTYKLTISLYAVTVRGAGVSLILSGADGKNIVIEGIAQNIFEDTAFIGNCELDDLQNGYTNGENTGTGYTSNEWKQYSFYIKGNAYKDYSYNLAVWLGTEGTNSNHAVTYRNLSQSSNSTTYTADGTFSTGWLFIDDLKLEEGVSIPGESATVKNVDADNKLKVNEIERDQLNAVNFVGAIVDLDAENQIADFLDPANDSTKREVESVGEGAPTQWQSNYDLTDSNNPRIDGFVREGVVNIASERDFDASVGDKIGEYPGLPYNMLDKTAYAMYASQDSYYEVETREIAIQANKFYRVSFWLKTVGVKETSGAYVYVLNKTAQQKNIDDGKGDDEVILTSITRINTDDYDEYLNDWVEINLVFRGAIKEDTNIALKFTLGTGNRWATTTLTSGALYVANFNMADLTYANYTGTSSSTYTKTCDLSTSYTYQFTNGSFDNYDLDDENLDESKNHLYDQQVPAAPESWTISDSTLSMNKDGADMYAGVIQLKDDDTADSPENFRFQSSPQAENATGVPSTFFDNFYGDKTSDNYYNEENMKSIAGPNVLALGSKSAEKFAIGFSSASFTLSSNTYNVLSLYAKTYGDTTATIRLTGEASGSGENYKNNHFTIKDTSTDNTGWTKYVFFIKVGKSSVSLKLNLWLGDDVQYAENPDRLEEDALKESVKSAGHVFFDNINSYTIEDEEKYNEALTAEKDIAQVNELDFDVDSFDPLSGSVEARRTLTSPSGWSGAAGTNQSSSNTKAGIIYTSDANYYDRDSIDGTEYAKILGKDYTEENSNITVSADELDEYRQEHPELNDVEDSEVREQIIAQKLHDLKVNNWIPVGEITEKGAISGDHMLVINNMTKSAYTYTSASNTLKGNKFYKVSVWMRTYGLNNSGNDDEFEKIEITDEELNEAKADPAYEGMPDEDIKTELRRKKNEIGAYIELYLGSANETGNEFTFKAVASSEWTQYSFYVQTLDDDVTSVTLKLSLGRYINQNIDGESVTTGLTTGYAMFDDVSITEVTEDDFNGMKNLVSDPEADTYDPATAKTNLTRTVSASESGSTDEPDTNTETPGSSFNLEYLWWMIPSIVIGLAIIIVLIVLLVRKIRKAAPKTVKIKKSPVSATSAQSLDEKHDRYDSDKD